jgi:hypothetical protein
MIPLVGLFVASTALAHLQIGTYSGKTPEGAACSIEILSKTYEGGVHHPLNERVAAKVGTETFTMVHPAVVSAEKREVSFDHDVLQAVLPLKNGARALVLKIDHTPGNDGPKSSHLIVNDWKQQTASSSDCLGLRFVQ